MDLVKDNIGKVFRHYLFAALGSAVIMSIYAFVDAIAVGQAEGPNGSAAMAVINPVFGIFVFLALVFGIGGSVLMSAARGENNPEEGNRWYTSAMIFMGAVTIIVWALFLIFHTPILKLFGADDEIMPLLMRYAWWLIGFAPLIISSIFLACYVRNDGNPGLALRAVLIGGGFNILGDWLLVFPLGLGITGAGMATIISNVLQTLILCTHFFSKRCSLKLVKPGPLSPRLKAICSIGFGAGMLDLANVILCALMNNQIMRYGNVSYLAVFGAVGIMASLFQALFSGVGQALQPVVSTNFGAKEAARIRSVLYRALLASLAMGILFTFIGVAFPQFVVRLFMDATPEVLVIAESTVRPYVTVFIFMSLNVVAIYYLQSTLQSVRSNIVSLARGLFVSGAFILIFPAVFGIAGIWYAIPAAELLTCVLALVWIFCPIKF